MSDTPRIYVACLAAYNNGILHGEWIDCDKDADEIESEIQEMLKSSPMPDAEEWAIHDSEGWYGIPISETEDLERLAEIAEILSENREAFGAFVKYYGEVDLEQFEEKYIGEYPSEVDFTEERFREDHEIPSYLENHIDWKSIATDWFPHSYISVETEGGCFIFTQ